MRENLNITQINGWENNYDHIYIYDKCKTEHPCFESYSTSKKIIIYNQFAHSEGLKKLPNHEWYFENGYIINVPKREWRELYNALTKKDIVTEYKNSFKKLAENLKYKHNVVLKIRKERGITKEENWKEKYEHNYIADRRKKEYPDYNELSKIQRRYRDETLAQKKDSLGNEGLKRKTNYEMHHENGYMINLPKKDHRKVNHIGDIGLQNQLNRLKELKGELPKKGLEKIGHDENGNTRFGNIEQVKSQKQKKSPQKTQKRKRKRKR